MKECHADISLVALIFVVGARHFCTTTKASSPQT